MNRILSYIASTVRKALLEQDKVRLQEMFLRKQITVEEFLHKMQRVDPHFFPSAEDVDSEEEAVEVWEAYMKFGLFPPMEWEWVERIGEEGLVELPVITVQEKSTHYVVEGNSWVPWDETMERAKRVDLELLVELVRKDFNFTTWNWMDDPELVTTAFKDGQPMDPFIVYSYNPQPTSGGRDVPDETQQDIYMELHGVLAQNAEQIWKWAKE